MPRLTDSLSAQGRGRLTSLAAEVVDEVLSGLYFYSRRNLTPRCLARQVLACDFRAVSFRRTW